MVCLKFDVNLTMLRWFLVANVLAATQYNGLIFQSKLQHKEFTTSPGPVPKGQYYRHPLLKVKDPQLHAAKIFLQSKFRLSPNDYVVKNNYRSDSNNITHIYFRQIVDSKEVFNGNINLNLNSQGHVISYGNSFYGSGTERAEGLMGLKFPHIVNVQAVDAVESLLNYLNVTDGGSVKIQELPIDFSSSYDNGIRFTNTPKAVQKPPRAQLGWLQNDFGHLEPVWDIKVRLTTDYYHGHVSAETSKPVALTNWARKATYKVIPLGAGDPDNGYWKRLSIDYGDSRASPLGWHSQGKNREFKDTAGNNVYTVNDLDLDSYNNLTSITRLTGHVDIDNQLEFDHPFNSSLPPECYQNASITNLFYYTNIIHDLFYIFGFDESAGNFQENNFNRGGLGNDAIIARNQDKLFKDNALFIAPPDGEAGAIYMFLFDMTVPDRDSSLDSGVVIHELAHGLSSRLTGGPSNADCLNADESNALSEGWSDAISNILLINSNHTRNSSFGIGNYVTGGNKGRNTMRDYMYSTSLGVNPLLYSYLNLPTFDEAHRAGAIWGSMLHEIYWNLVDRLGHSENWFNEASHDLYGNTLMLQILIDAMKLQPCNPSFLDARDAIIQAESLKTGGRFQCVVWAGFAKRGLGFYASSNPGKGKNAKIVYIDSFDLPPTC